MILTDHFSKVRLASSFTMTPQQAVGELDIESTGSLEGDRDLLKGLLGKFHPDVAKTEDAPVKMKAVNVLWETFIRQGKPIDVHTQPQQPWNLDVWWGSWDQRYQEPQPSYDDPRQGDGPTSSDTWSSSGELDDWLETYIPEIEEKMERVQEALLQANRDMGIDEAFPDQRILTAIHFLGQTINLIQRSGYADPQQHGSWGMQLRQIMDTLAMMLTRVKHSESVWKRRGEEVTADYLKKCVDEMDRIKENHGIFDLFNGSSYSGDPWE